MTIPPQNHFSTAGYRARAAARREKIVTRIFMTAAGLAVVALVVVAVIYH